MTCLDEISYPKDLTFSRKVKFKKIEISFKKRKEKNFLRKIKTPVCCFIPTIPVHHAPLPPSKGKGWGWVGSGS